MQRTSWSTIAAEQGHASLALMAKNHHNAGLPSLITRSHLHQSRALFAQHQLQQQQQQSISKNVSKAKQFWRIGSRQAFLATVYESLKLESGQPLSQQVRSSVMRRHAAEFASLSDEQRQYYEKKAKSIRVHKLQQQQDLQDLRLAAAEIQAMRSQSETSLSFSFAKLGFAVMNNAELSRLQNHAVELHEVPLARRSVDYAAPNPPSQADKDMIQGYPAEEFMPEFPLIPPLWAVVVCRNRDLFKTCVLAMPDFKEFKMNYYLVLFAMQKPYVLVLAPLNLIPVEVDEFPEVVSTLSEPNTHCNFRWDGFTVCDAATLPAHDVREVCVHPGALALGDWVFQCDKISFSLQEFAGSMATAKAAKKTDKKESSKRRGPAAEDIANHPWLAKYTSHEASGRRRAPTLGPKASQNDDDEPLSPDAVDRAFATLQAKRAEWSSEHTSEAIHFKAVVRGGAWTQAHRQVAVDSMAAQACTSEAKAFCAKYGLAKLASYSYLKYGERVAQTMARCWVDKMTFWHDLYVEAEDPDFVFTDEVLKSYPEPSDMSALRAELASLHRGVKERILQWELLVPKNSAGAGSLH